MAVRGYFDFYFTLVWDSFSKSDSGIGIQIYILLVFLLAAVVEVKLKCIFIIYFIIFTNFQI